MARAILARSRLALLAGLALILAQQSAQANPKIYARALAATGWLVNPCEDNIALGTCWVVDHQRRLAITSAHLIKKSEEVLVYFPESQKGRIMAEASHYLHKVSSIRGLVVAVDRPRDLALVKLDSLPDSVKELPLAAESCAPGDDVHSVGNSGLSKTNPKTLWRYTRGSVRQLYQRKVKTDDGERDMVVVETQSPVNKGDSGGALLNDRGEVVGVVAAYESDERLVSQNVDVCEVRNFLKNALPRLEKNESANGECKTPRFSLVGAWKVSAKLEDKSKAQGTAKFNGDGTYRMDDSGQAEEEGHAGRFAFANGVLFLIAEDGHAILHVTWEGKDRFNATSEGVHLVFDR